MRKILIFLLIAGVLMLGTVSICEVGEITVQDVDFSERDVRNSGGDPTPDGGGSGGEGPAPG